MLSAEPHTKDGWTIGVYHDDFESEIRWHDQAEAKMPAEAARLAIGASRAAAASRRGCS